MNPCAHDFSPWQSGSVIPGTDSTRTWKRKCQKCKITETKFGKEDFGRDTGWVPTTLREVE